MPRVVKPGRAVRRLAAVAASCVLASLAACGSPSPGSPAGRADHATSTTAGGPAAGTSSSDAASTSTLDPGRVVAAPSTPTTVPHERGVRPIDPAVDNGQQILITRTAFVPAQLFADVTKPVVWTNLSGKTQTVVFDVIAVHSPPIPAGAQFVWHPSTTLDLAYHSASGLRGALILQPHTRD
jgi:hypothetical protein